MFKSWSIFLCLACSTFKVNKLKIKKKTFSALFKKILFQLMATQPVGSIPTTELEISNNNIVLNSKIDLLARHNLLLEFEKHFAQLSRVAIQVILEKLQAQTERSVVTENKITTLSAALAKIENINLIDEPLDKNEVRFVTNTVADLFESNILRLSDLNESPKLVFEIQRFNEIFEEVFNDFIGTLTPEEQLLDAELIKVHKLYEASNEGEKWGVLPKVWQYFEI